MGIVLYKEYRYRERRKTHILEVNSDEDSWIFVFILVLQFTRRNVPGREPWEEKYLRK